MSTVPSQPDRHGMDRTDMWRVMMNIGKPRPEARVMPTPSTRLVVLLVILILSALLGVVAHGAEGAGRARGAVGVQEPVKKGPGGPAHIQITPLEKLENFPHLSGHRLSNFLQNFLHPVRPLPGPRAPLVMPIRVTDDEAAALDASMAKWFIALVGALCLMLWTHLRATRGMR